jgi:predicted ATPase
VALVVLTGASGSGKTTLARAIEARRGKQIEVRCFDSIGVPPAELRAEGWQRATTIQWMHQIASVLRSGRSVLFEGQTRFSFLKEAIAATSIVDYRLVLVDCDDATRARRLVTEREQPELATMMMMTWARFLRDEARRGGHEILDTSDTSLKLCIERVCRHF